MEVAVKNKYKVSDYFKLTDEDIKKWYKSYDWGISPDDDGRPSGEYTAGEALCYTDGILEEYEDGTWGCEVFCMEGSGYGEGDTPEDAIEDCAEQMGEGLEEDYADGIECAKTEESLWNFR